MTDWRQVRSSQQSRPKEIDTDSATTVYERKDIHQETITDPMTEEQYTEWVYDERSYSKEEYANLNSPSFQLLMQNLSEIEVDVMSLSLGGLLDE